MANPNEIPKPGDNSIQKPASETSSLDKHRMPDPDEVKAALKGTLSEPVKPSSLFDIPTKGGSPTPPEGIPPSPGDFTHMPESYTGGETGATDESGVVGNALRTMDDMAGVILGRVSPNEAAERAKGRILGPSTPEHPTDSQVFLPKDGVYNPVGPPGLDRMAGDPMAVVPGADKPGNIIGDGKSSRYDFHDNPDGTKDFSYSGKLRTADWNPAHWRSDTKYTSSEKMKDDKLLERHVNYEHGVDLKFQTPDGTKEIPNVKSVDTKYDRATGGYDTIINTEDNKHYRAQTATDGHVTEFAETPSGSMLKNQVISNMLEMVPEGVMSHEQKATMKKLLLDSSGVDVDPSNGTFHVSSLHESCLGQLHLDKDLSFKIGLGIPPALTDIHGVTGPGGVELSRLGLDFDESGNPVLKPDIRIPGLGSEATIPPIRLSDLLGPHE